MHEAASLVAASGYDKLTMRAVARASGMKLGALQYHFATRDDLLRGLAAHVTETYSEAFAAFQRELPGGPTVADLVQFLMDDVAGDRLDADRLFPQLWAMSLVEPIMEELIDNLYDEYLVTLAETLRLVDVEHPEAEAIAIMSLVDGLTLFIGEGRRWARHRTGASRVVFDMVAERYGLPIPIGV